MHEWQEVIQNPNASIEDRAAAMLKNEFGRNYTW